LAKLILKPKPGANAVGSIKEKHYYQVIKNLEHDLDICNRKLKFSIGCNMFLLLLTTIIRYFI
jgi:hypothetical protein